MINTNLEEIAKRGDIRAYRIAHLAIFIMKAEEAEGRTNRCHIRTLEMLVEELESRSKSNG